MAGMTSYLLEPVQDSPLVAVHELAALHQHLDRLAHREVGEAHEHFGAFSVTVFA